MCLSVLLLLLKLFFLCMYITLIHHPALTRGLRVLQNENKSPKSPSASQSCAPYNQFFTSLKATSNNLNKSQQLLLLYLKYIKVRQCYWDWPWPAALPPCLPGLLRPWTLQSSCWCWVMAATFPTVISVLGFSTVILPRGESEHFTCWPGVTAQQWMGRNKKGA